MARSVTIKAIDRRPARGITYLRVGKSEIEILGTTPAEVVAWARTRISEDSDELLAALAIVIWAARNPDFSNPGQIVGRTITLDPAGRLNYPDSVVRVS